MNPRQKLENLGIPYVTLRDLAKAMDINYGTLWYRIAALPANEKPEAFGAFRAGGHLAMTVDVAANWAEYHLTHWQDPRRKGEAA